MNCCNRVAVVYDPVQTWCYFFSAKALADHPRVKRLYDNKYQIFVFINRIDVICITGISVEIILDSNRFFFRQFRLGQKRSSGMIQNISAHSIQIEIQYIIGESDKSIGKRIILFRFYIPHRKKNMKTDKNRQDNDHRPP